MIWNSFKTWFRYLPIVGKSLRYPKGDYYYERILTRYKDIFTYHELIESVNHKELLFTAQTIQEQSPKNLFLKKYSLSRFPFLGKRSNFRITNKFDSFIIDIFFFKTLLGGHRARLETHHYKNSTFLYTYTFLYLTPEEKRDILSIIQDKYQLDKNINIEKNCIIDKNQNTLLITDNVTFTIHYILKTNGPFYANLVEYISHQQSRKLRKEKQHYHEMYQKL